jgi:hypothetical protein
MEKAFHPLDPLAEALALTSCGNVKNLVFGAAELEGALDEKAVRSALRRIEEEFPHLTMHLKEAKQGRKHYVGWDRHFRREIPLVVLNGDRAPQTGCSLQRALHYLRPEMERPCDLLNEPLCTVFVLEQAAERYMIAFFCSHVAADAITAMEIAKRFMIHYHELATGQKPPFADAPLAASTIRKRAVPKTKTVWKDYWFTFRQAMIPYRVKCTLPGGDASPAEQGEHHVKRALTPELSQQVLVESSQKRSSLVDHLLGTMSEAVDCWNAGRGVKSGTITAALTVNMQGRFEDMEGPNSDSVLYFVLKPEERKDSRTLARCIALSRIRQLRDRMDWKYYRAIAKLNHFFRVFPFSQRQRIFGEMLRRHQTSFALGFMGTIWPTTNQRVMTERSGIESSGGLTISEVHGAPYKLVSRTPLYLSAYFFRQRLNLVLSAAGWHFTRQNTEDFLDLIVELLAPRSGREQG